MSRRAKFQVYPVFNVLVQYTLIILIVLLSFFHWLKNFSLKNEWRHLKRLWNDFKLEEFECRGAQILANGVHALTVSFHRPSDKSNDSSKAKFKYCAKLYANISSLAKYVFSVEIKHN